MTNGHYVIEEQMLVAKTGKPEDNEDSIHSSPTLVAIIDGATSKTARRWDGKTGGQTCAQLINQTLSNLSPTFTAREAIDSITARIQAFYQEREMREQVQVDPSQRASAALIVANLHRRELWLVGDCQCLLDQRLIQNPKRVDTVTAEARAMFLEAELQKGLSLEALRHHDTGRAFILPLLQQQQHFQNNLKAGPYWFPAIDGFPVPDEGILVEPIPEGTQTIILASDGYPFLKESLGASEQALQDILMHDPLLFRLHKATKGMQEGYCSYDDRSYVKLKLL